MLETGYLNMDFTFMLDDEDYQVPAKIQQATSAVWQTKPPHVFDGEIFFVTDFSESQISGSFLPYRYLFARRRDAVVASYFEKMPTLAVTGCVRCVDGELLFGKRTGQVEQDKECWEFLPAGGVGREAMEGDRMINPVKSLHNELEEEADIDPALLSDEKAFAYIWDKENGVLDIGVKANLNMMSSMAIAGFHGNSEYEKISVFPPSVDALAPVSRQLLDLYFLS